VVQDVKGGERDGNLDDDRADRQEPDFELDLPIHVFRLVDPQGYEGTGEAHHQEDRNCCGDEVN
jgi:hypothetical protein